LDSPKWNESSSGRPKLEESSSETPKLNEFSAESPRLPNAPYSETSSSGKVMLISGLIWKIDNTFGKFHIYNIILYKKKVLIIIIFS
jgi:hypothetical protein